MAAQGAPIPLAARRVPLDTDDPARDTIGSLRFRGALVLSSSDVRFGGISDIVVDADGETFIAVSDGGHWISGRLLYETGMLAGAAEVRMEPLRFPNGKVVKWWKDRDAEALARHPADGTLVVAFERDHRLWAYRHPGAQPVPVPAPSDLAHAPVNGGIEALVWLAAGRLLAICEEFGDGGGVRAWLTEEGNGWAPLKVAVSGRFRPTGAAMLPNGDVLVVERRFPPVGARIRRFRATEIRADAALAGVEIARLEGSLTVDNMEAIAARQSADGRVFVYLASDDNYSRFQRTLLMMFELVQ